MPPKIRKGSNKKENLKIENVKRKKKKVEQWT